MLDETPIRRPRPGARLAYKRDLGDPGQFPFTRGIHATMYRGRLWTMRQFAGFGSPEDTNRRFKRLLEEGQTGLSVAFDNPTLYGFDADEPLALGQAGYGGVSVSSLADMEALFDGIDLSRVSTSMTINAPAPVIFAMFLAVAEKQGVPFRDLRGTLQNDILKEYFAQKEWIFLPAPAVRLVVDVIEFCTRQVPQWNPVSISGYHIREAGSSAVQELAYTLADGIAYVEAGRARGLRVDEFAPRLSFFFNSYVDGSSGFLQEIAKLRAARRMWARTLRYHFQARDPRSWLLRMHAQTSGDSLKEEQPLNNIVRAAFQALAGVLGGTQSLHVDAYDEQLSLPSEHAAVLALRTQQMIAYETGLADIPDPLGGSWALESLTHRMEAEASRLIEEIDRAGGMVAAIEARIPQRAIEDESYRKQQAVDSGEVTVVGVNRYQTSAEQEAALRGRYEEACRAVRDELARLAQRPAGIGGDGAMTRLEELLRERERAFHALQLEQPEPFEVDRTTPARQLQRLADVRANRNAAEVEKSLGELADAAKAAENLMPYLIGAVKAYATLGEIRRTLIPILGEYREGD